MKTRCYIVWLVAVLTVSAAVDGEAVVRVRVMPFEDGTGVVGGGELAEALWEGALLGLVHVRGVAVVPEADDSAAVAWTLRGRLAMEGDVLRLGLSLHLPGRVSSALDSAATGSGRGLLTGMAGMAAACAVRSGIAVSPAEQERIAALAFPLDADGDAMGLFYRMGAGVYEDLGMYRKAAGMYRKAAARVDDAAGSGIADLFLRASVACRKAGVYEPALDLVRSAAKIHRRHGMALEEAEDEGHLGQIYARMGDVRRAGRAFSGAEKRLEKLLRREGKPAIEGALAQVLNHTGDMLAAVGRTEKALAAYGRAVAIQDRLKLGPRQAETLRDMGILHANQGETAKALDLYDRAMVIQVEFGAERDLAETWMASADARIVRGDYDSALVALEEAQRIWTQAGREGDLAEVLVKKGEVRAQQEDAAAALRFYAEAQAIQERLGLRRAAARTEVLAGNAYVIQGLLNRAMDAYRHAEAVQIQMGLEADLVRTCQSIGYVHRMQGAFSGAEDFYKRAEEIARKRNLQAELGSIYHAMGGCYASSGEVHRALGYYGRARKVWQNLGWKAELATVTNHIGIVYEALHETGRAEQHYEEALALAKEIDFRLGIAVCAERLGMFRARTVGPEAGLALMREAREVRLAGNMRVGLARTICPGLARIYERMGDTEAAVACYEEGLAIADTLSLGEEAVSLRYLLGRLYCRTGRYEASLAMLEGAASRADRWTGKTKKEDVLEAVGLTRMHMGRWGEAIDAFDRALDLCAPQSEPLSGRTASGGLRVDLEDEKAAYLWEMRGMTLGMSGRWEDALASYRQGMALLGDIGQVVGSARRPNPRRIWDRERDRNFYLDDLDHLEDQKGLSRDLRDWSERLRDDITSMQNRVGVARYHTADLDGGDNGPPLEEWFGGVHSRWRQGGNREQMAVASNNLGVVGWARGDHGRMLDALNEGIQTVAGRHTVMVDRVGAVNIPDAEEVRVAHAAAPLLLNLSVLLEAQSRQEGASDGIVAQPQEDRASIPIAEALRRIDVTVQALTDAMTPYPLAWQTEVLLIREFQTGRYLK